MGFSSSAGGSSSGAGGSSKGGSSKVGSSSAVIVEEPEKSPQNDEEAMSRTEAIMGVHPVRFVDDVYNFCTQYIKRSVDSLEGTLASDEETKEDPTAVKDGCAGCQARLIGAFDKNIDKFELYVVRNCMRIPVHIDESSASIIAAAGAVTAGLDGKSGTAEEEAALDDELDVLRRKVQAAKFVNESLKHKLSSYSESLESFKPLSHCFGEADRLASENGVPDLAGGAMRVLELGAEVAALEKQYMALEKLQDKENPGGVASRAGMGEQTLASCRGNMGFPSTRELNKLGQVLGV